MPGKPVLAPTNTSTVPRLSCLCKKIVVPPLTSVKPSPHAINWRQCTLGGESPRTRTTPHGPPHMTSTLQQLTASPTAKTRSGFLLLPGLIGFIFAFRACFTVLWFTEEPQQGAIVSVALSFTLLTAAVLSTMGSTPSIPTSCFRNPTLRWIAAFLGLN